MFVGHYGPGFLIKKIEPRVPLWALFLAVQFLDLLWAPLVLTGVEKVRIVPFFTASNPYDLYYMPYSHGFLTALFWSVVVGALYQFAMRPVRSRVGVLVGLAVFSHWLLDLVVHVPDLPLYGDSAKVGLGLWNMLALAFGLESALLLGAMWVCFREERGTRHTWVFGLVLIGILAYNTFLAPPPSSDRVFAMMALVASVVFTTAIWWLRDRHSATTST